MSESYVSITSTIFGAALVVAGNFIYFKLSTHIADKKVILKERLTKLLMPL